MQNILTMYIDVDRTILEDRDLESLILERAMLITQHRQT